MSKTGIEWTNVNWRLKDAEIARMHACRASTVHYARKRYGSRPSSTLDAFDAMASEQRADFEDYLRRCGGAPISSVRPDVTP